MFADPLSAGVHEPGDLGEVGVAFRVACFGDLGGPGGGRERDEGSVAAADAGVDDGGDVAGSAQVPFGDGGGDDLGRVQAGQFRSAQRRPQPFRLMGQFLPVARQQGSREQVLAALFPGRDGFRGPDGVQDGQVVGTGQGLLPGLGRRQLLAVAAQHLGQYPERVLVFCGCGSRVIIWLGGEAVVTGQFGGRAGAGREVGPFG